MKTKIMLLVLAAILSLPACSSAKEVLPFSPKHKYGKLPCKKNKRVKHSTAWTFRQWGHQGR